VDLVEEEHGLASVEVAGPVGCVHDGTHVLDAGRHGGELDELAVGSGGDQVRQGGLAGARRSPQDRRERTRGAAASLDESTQGAALAEHVSLAANLLDRPRPHPDGQRAHRRVGRGDVPGGRGEEITHPRNATRGV
jgi:hypothetical protein